MSSKDAHLYGIPRPKKASSKEISSSTGLAFTSTLSSLIAASKPGSSTSPTTSGRSRPGRKDDIFKTHNKNYKKRALKDLEDSPFTQKHSTGSEALDEETWHRAKRKMEQKARLYGQMKRGELEDTEEKLMVDFDRKWAEAQDRDEDTTSSGDSDGDDGEQEMVEYIDEFGRTRRGTKAEAAREERRKKMAMDEPDRFTARPAAPANIIYGDAIQSAAFNPDERIAEQMAALAAKRDRAETPPPDTHFDGTKEVRTKGVGFFQFSSDKDERKRQMEGLKKEREETERMRKIRKEREKKMKERKKAVEERKRAIREKKNQKQTDRFLDNLMVELQAKGGHVQDGD